LTPQIERNKIWLIALSFQDQPQHINRNRWNIVHNIVHSSIVHNIHILSSFQEICLKNLKISGNQQGNRDVPRHGCCNDATRVGLGVRINQLDEEIVDIFAGHRLRLQEAWLLWEK